MYPFTKKSVVVLSVILAFFTLFYTVEFPFIPLINIVLKSLIIAVVYGVLIFKMNISEDLNSLIYNLIKRN